MPQVRYQPKPGGAFYAPTLQPGEVIEVSRDEARNLLATGAFVDATPVAHATVTTDETAKRQKGKE